MSCGLQRLIEGPQIIPLCCEGAPLLCTCTVNCKAILRETFQVKSWLFSNNYLKNSPQREGDLKLL